MTHGSHCYDQLTGRPACGDPQGHERRLQPTTREEVMAVLDSYTAGERGIEDAVDCIFALTGFAEPIADAVKAEPNVWGPLGEVLDALRA